MRLTYPTSDYSHAHSLLEKPNWQQLFVYFCIGRGFEEEDFFENLHSVLICLIKKLCLTFCVFLIFFQNASSQLCFRFFFFFLGDETSQAELVSVPASLINVDFMLSGTDNGQWKQL